MPFGVSHKQVSGWSLGPMCQATEVAPRGGSAPARLMRHHRVHMHLHRRPGCMLEATGREEVAFHSLLWASLARTTEKRRISLARALQPVDRGGARRCQGLLWTAAGWRLVSRSQSRPGHALSI